MTRGGRASERRARRPARLLACTSGGWSGGSAGVVPGPLVAPTDGPGRLGRAVWSSLRPTGGRVFSAAGPVVDVVGRPRGGRCSNQLVVLRRPVGAARTGRRRCRGRRATPGRAAACRRAGAVFEPVPGPTPTGEAALSVLPPRRGGGGVRAGRRQGRPASRRCADRPSAGMPFRWRATAVTSVRGSRPCPWGESARSACRRPAPEGVTWARPPRPVAPRWRLSWHACSAPSVPARRSPPRRSRRPGRCRRGPEGSRSPPGRGSRRSVPRCSGR